MNQYCYNNGFEEYQRLSFLLIQLNLSNSVWKQPNVILILTDDQDVTLNGMMPMQNVNKMIGLAGATFRNAVCIITSARIQEMYALKFVLTSLSR